MRPPIHDPMPLSAEKASEVTSLFLPEKVARETEERNRREEIKELQPRIREAMYSGRSNINFCVSSDRQKLERIISTMSKLRYSSTPIKEYEHEYCLEGRLNDSRIDYCTTFSWDKFVKK